MRKHFTAILLTILFVPVLLHARVEGHFDRTLTVSGAVTLDLTTGSGDVTVKAGGSNQVIIHATIQSNNEWFSSNEGAVHAVESNPPVEQSGSTIRVGHNLPDDVKRHVSISYEVTAPADTAVLAHSGSGTIEVSGVRSGVEATTGSGDIKLSDTGGRTNVHTGSGTIRADNVSAPFSGHTGSGDIEAQLMGSGDVDVQSGSGSVSLRGIKGGLHARTGSGDIEADGDVKGPWQIHTGSGGVRIAFGSGSGFNLDVHASSGSIHTELPITVQGSLSHNELKGSVRGGGPDVEVSTGSGNITIR